MAERMVISADLIPKTAIGVDARILGGTPVVVGTRIPAETIVAYLRAGHTSAEIHADYPALPTDGIDAVEAWAVREYGADWRSLAVPSRT